MSNLLLALAESSGQIADLLAKFQGQRNAACYFSIGNAPLGGIGNRSPQEFLVHANLQTTMISTHVAGKNIVGVKNPLDD